MTKDDTIPATAMTPTAINHLVLNVTNLERSHAFWTETIGFQFVVGMDDAATGKRRAAFYTAEQGTGHHDLGLFEVTDPSLYSDMPTEHVYTPRSPNLGVNHIAIKYKDPETWSKQLAFLQSKGVTFHMRTEHGMTHSAYITDPDGYGIEILYEVPKEKWEQNPAAALVWAERVAKEGPEALRDNTDYKVFTPA